MKKCLIVDDDEIIRTTLKHYIEQTDGLELVDSVESAIQAMPILKNEAIDVLLLDVEMPEMSGIDLLDVLKDTPYVILVTSKEEYAIKAFEYNVTDYLLKPVQYARFVKSMERIMEVDQSLKAVVDDHVEVYIKSDLKYIKINIKEITHIEAMADYVMFFMENGKKYIVHSTMKALELKLPSNMFVRVHRSYILNMKAVESADSGTINVGGQRIPIGASYRSGFFDRLKMF
jgi:DNA-binding LytR/AlgR family response regulator